MALTPKQNVWRYRIEKWFWWLMTALVIVLDLCFPSLWQAISIPYIAFVSNYALALAAGSAEQGAEASLQASDEESE